MVCSDVFITKRPDEICKHWHQYDTQQVTHYVVQVQGIQQRGNWKKVVSHRRATWQLQLSSLVVSRETFRVNYVSLCTDNFIRICRHQRVVVSGSSSSAGRALFSMSARARPIDPTLSPSPRQVPGLGCYLCRRRADVEMSVRNSVNNRIRVR